MSGAPAFDREQMLAWLHASCTAQQVPRVIRDAAVVGQLVILLGGDTGPRGRSSVAPDRVDPRQLEAARATAGGDHDLIEYGAHDGLATIQTQPLPRVA